ncbi:MAG: protein-glutamate O-methyltransferase CheR [Nitrospirae bacterium]|nr:protein-glutamate O-methyltransferase CheR [Nitrospirota bacterium]
MTSFSKNEVMTEREFRLLSDLVTGEFGIVLKGNKRLTVHARISHRLSILGLSSYTSYHDYIVADLSGKELLVLASHLTNKETYFFRDRAQLSLFSEVLKDVKSRRQRAGQRAVSIMSLGSSSGEEAYSLNILLKESGLFMPDWDVRITGIDLDGNAIMKAREACYTGNSFRDINGDAGLLDKYFSAQGGKFLLRKSLREDVEFRQGNIMDPGVYKGISEVDVIFCRNVLIYMSDEAVARIIGNLHALLSDTGYLFMGSSESLILRTDIFVPEYVGDVIVYRKNPKRKGGA